MTLPDEACLYNAARCQRDELRAEIERLLALSTELYEALDACVTWLPSGFAPQSQSTALVKANKAMANYRAALEPKP